MLGQGGRTHNTQFIFRQAVLFQKDVIAYRSRGASQTSVITAGGLGDSTVYSTVHEEVRGEQSVFLFWLGGRNLEFSLWVAIALCVPTPLSWGNTGEASRVQSFFAHCSSSRSGAPLLGSPCV